MNHAQLTYALSLFVSSGYDLQEAVHYTIELVDNSQLQNQLKQCYHDLEQGVSFVDAVSQHQIYKGMKLNMIQIGFQTGQVDAVMKTLSNHYQIIPTPYRGDGVAGLLGPVSLTVWETPSLKTKVPVR